VFSILSMIGSHGVALSRLFPIHAPRDLTGVPSHAILIKASYGWSSSLSFLVSANCSLWDLVPISKISVFSKLNLAPDAMHQCFKMSYRSLYQSPFLRYIMVWSAYRFMMTQWVRPGILNPYNFFEFLREHASGFIAGLNSRHDNGSPWWMPLVTLNGLLKQPFIATLVYAFLYRAWTVLTNLAGRLKWVSISIR
jgi:hypothetical protein